jgi:hypothetical protein
MGCAEEPLRYENCGVFSITVPARLKGNVVALLRDLKPGFCEVFGEDQLQTFIPLPVPCTNPAAIPSTTFCSFATPRPRAHPVHLTTGMRTLI